MSDVFTAYEALVASGELRADAEQAAAARRLAGLQDALEADARPSLFAASPTDQTAARLRRKLLIKQPREKRLL